MSKSLAGAQRCRDRRCARHWRCDRREVARRLRQCLPLDKVAFAEEPRAGVIYLEADVTDPFSYRSSV